MAGRPATWERLTLSFAEVLERHVSDGSELEAYLCGSPGMIRAAGEVLAKKGVPRERTYYDEFA